MGRPRAFDERQVLDAVGRSFWETGYAATSLDEIMRASGLGKGSLYAAFGDKYALFRRVFDEYCTTVVHANAAALSGSDDSALERLTSWLERAANRTTDGAAQQACFLAKTTAELAARDTAVSERARRAFEEITQNILTCVQQGQRAGDIDPDADAGRQSHHLLVVARGIEALAEAGVPSDTLLDSVAIALSTLRPQLSR
jgi:TetR/AcrR family transcriptional repressor of nem operon